MGRYDSGWQNAISQSSHSYSTGGRADCASVPSEMGAKVVIAGAATAGIALGYQIITTALASASLMTTGFVASQIGDAQKSGAKCYAGVAAQAALTETPKNLGDVVWNDRSWTDYLPLTGDHGEPYVFTAVKASQTGIHDLSGTITEEAAKDGLSHALGGGRRDIVEDGKQSIKRGVKKLIAAECEDFNGSMNTIKLGLGVLGTIVLTLAVVKAANSYFSKDRS
ncbi:MAG: hypothetical protein S4CHLAM37_09560 [Chlamydiia bacterium]|nr:hypothetical protein [Chlamydiia bacterium]